MQTVHRVTGQPVHVPLGTHANKQGRVAGINIGGGYATFPGVIGTAVTKVCELEVARTGLREAEAEQAGYAFVTAVGRVDQPRRLLPGAGADDGQADRREAVPGGCSARRSSAREGAAKRIDALAIAIWNGMTVEEMTGTRSVVRAAVRAGVGPGADRRPQGLGRRRARRPR